MRKVSCLRGCLAALLVALATPAFALTFTIGGPASARFIFLQVGTGTPGADNGTRDKASTTVPGESVGSGVPFVLSTNSLTTGPTSPGTLSCTLPQQIYITAQHRRPGGSAPATLSVLSPANLVGGAHTIPINQISWTTEGGAGIPASGTFNGATQTLASLGTNNGLEHCLTLRYANSQVMPAGTFTGTLRFSLVAP